MPDILVYIVLLTHIQLHPVQFVHFWCIGTQFKDRNV